jgi:RNA polymerase sigma-70 factor (ECF subfamily)
MPVPQMTGDFHADLKTMLPRLRVYALALARDPDRADDLVQQTVVKSLVGRKSFQPGTNFGGWLFRIQRNEFISGLRAQRPTVPLDDTIADTLSHEPRQESGLIMREFKNAFDVLSACQREALLLAVLEGYGYDRIAAHTGVSVGTVKSRIWRARAKLKQILTREDASPESSSHSLASDRQSRWRASVHAVAGR